MSQKVRMKAVTTELRLVTKGCGLQGEINILSETF